MKERIQRDSPIAFHKEPPETFREETREVPMTLGKPLPNPGEESVGPGLFDLVVRTHRSIEVQSELLRAAMPLLNKRIVVESSTGQTDGSGNVVIPLYRVPQGMQLVITRVNFDDGVSTPAVPFTFATGFVELITAEAYAPGTIVDFLPNPPVASGPIFPGQFTDGSDEASVIRGGQVISLNVFHGPINRDIWCRLQGFEEPI